MHNGLVRLFVKVALPTGYKALHVVLLELLLCWPDLDASFDAVGSQRTRAVDVPLLKDLLLDFRFTTEKVIEAFGIRLGSIGRKGKVVILEVETDTRKIDHRLDTGFTQLLRVTDSGALKYKRGAEGAARNHDLLAGSDDFLLLLLRMEWFHRDALDGDSFAVFYDYLVYLGVAHKVQVLVRPAQGDVLAGADIQSCTAHLMVECM